MRTLYGLAKIATMTRKIIHRWHNRFTRDDRPGDALADAGLLVRRMSALGIDSDAFAQLEPAIFGNLRTLCRECERPDLCRHDLRHDPAAVAWEDYCRNAVVLNAVKELRWFRMPRARAPLR